MMDDMDDGEGGMQMTFGKWSDYRVKVVWDGWDITSKTEFAFSWLMVLVMGVFYHVFRYTLLRVEEDMRKMVSSSYEGLLAGEKSDGMGISVSEDASGMLMLRIKHACLSALHYTLALLLMLVAMTYNPSLFLAVCLGYGLGDFLVIRATLFSTKNLSGYACH